MSDATAYKLQRLTAIVLAIMVMVHLAVIIYAIEGGLSSAEILSRTRSSLVWPVFYTGFVVAAAIHAPIGLRNILMEWAPISARILNPLMVLFAVTLLFTGLRAVVAIM